MRRDKIASQIRLADSQSDGWSVVETPEELKQKADSLLGVLTQTLPYIKVEDQTADFGIQKRLIGENAVFEFWFWPQRLNSDGSAYDKGNTVGMRRLNPSGGTVSLGDLNESNIVEKFKQFDVIGDTSLTDQLPASLQGLLQQYSEQADSVGISELFDMVEEILGAAKSNSQSPALQKLKQYADTHEDWSTTSIVDLMNTVLHEFNIEGV